MKKRSCPVLCLLLIASVVAAGDPQEPSTTTLPTTCLQLGPVAEPLPVFHDAATAGWDLEKLLAEQRYQDSPPARAGASIGWLTGETLTWREIEIGDGLVELSPPAADQPAVAWLAFYLHSDRYVSTELLVTTGHGLRLWLDGTLQTGTAGAAAAPGTDPGPTRYKLGLSTGKHLLLLKTVRNPELSTPWQVGLALETPTGSPQVACTTDPTRDIEIQDLLDAPAVAKLAASTVSPDGSLVALNLSRVLPGTSSRQRWTEVRSTSDGSLVRSWRGSPDMHALAWAPSGHRLSYVTTDKEQSTLWLLDLDSGEVQPIVAAVEHWGSYTWSPSGSFVVFQTSVEPEPETRGVKRLQGPLDRMADYRTKSYLSLVTVPGGVVRRLTAGGLSTELAAIAPDGSRLLFTREIEDPLKRPFTHSEVWQLELATMMATRLLDLPWLNGISYSPDGQRLLVLTAADALWPEGRALPEGVIANSYDGQLFLWDPEQGTADAITRDLDPAVEEAVWSHADGKIYLRADVRDRISLLQYDPQAASFTTLDLGLEVVSSFALAGQQPVLVAEGTSVWQPQRVLAVDLGDGSTRELLEPAAERYADVRRGSIRPWRFTADSGQEIDGRIYLPPGFDPAHRYPLIVYYYGGTLAVDRAFGGRYPKEWWAANGYVVAVLQPSGATGWGQAFSARHVNDWGKIAGQEVIDGTRRLLEELPYVDDQRVGCIGASFGGFLTLSLLTRTDLFHAAVAHAGISAISSYWGEGYWGYLYGAVANAGSFPWNRPDLFVEHSPLFHADQIATPLLLTHGTADPNVPPGESSQIYLALKLLGVPVEYLQFADQQHFIAEHDQRLLWSRSIVAWFDRWLKDQPEWWNALYPPLGEGPSAVDP